MGSSPATVGAATAVRAWRLAVLAAALLGLLGSVAGEGVAAPSPEDYVDRAVSLHRRGACGRAIPLLQKAIALDPRYARAHAWLGFCHVQLGRRQEALAAFQRVVALAPRSEDARVARQWIARLQPAAGPRAQASPPAPPDVVYLVTLHARAGITRYNHLDQVALGGVVYRRALVEYRNWWQRRSQRDREWRVVYGLERRYARFRARAGAEDSAPPEFTASFEVRGDGASLFAGTTKRAGDAPDVIDVDVSGVEELELIARARDPLYTRGLAVIWADPHLVLAPGGAPASPPPSPRR
ncbi:MAG: NPCBM/NEW2 domain-containing protein [Armatimonadota bacterium]|nr:NPCBM/NEW2 domain-containing protein [Armatimonadota bacterium]MDR7532010.1 NPCBM/NEW2 domain-containing protein [Armatimonadota bacterium]MDR7535941.1 NPCBM/NEW2 domain-containing protein [Armatimonadota bacterium]